MVNKIVTLTVVIGVLLGCESDAQSDTCELGAYIGYVNGMSYRCTLPYQKICDTSGFDMIEAQKNVIAFVPKKSKLDMCAVHNLAKSYAQKKFGITTDGDKPIWEIRSIDIEQVPLENQHRYFKVNFVARGSHLINPEDKEPQQVCVIVLFSGEIVEHQEQQP
jgi:hypothetical protein